MHDCCWPTRSSSALCQVLFLVLLGLCTCSKHQTETLLFLRLKFDFYHIIINYYYYYYYCYYYYYYYYFYYYSANGCKF